MPRLTKKRLIDLVRQALVRHGWTVTVHTFSGQHPAKLELQRSGRTARVLLYIWSLTHGGATRATDEYRIQITSGVRSFGTEDDYRTIILGYSDEFGTFVGFDFDRRSGRLGASPSIQISRATIEGALVRGVATQDKGRGELAIAVRPDVLGEYLANAAALHRGDLSGIRPRELVEGEFASLLDARAQDVRHDYSFGSTAEVRQRYRIEERAAALERAADTRLETPGRDHNNPPELLPDEASEVLAEVKRDAAAIGAEMKKATPDVADVAKRGGRLTWIKDFLAGTAKAASEDLQGKIGRAISAGAFIAVAAAVPGLTGLLMELLREIVRWLQILF